LGILPVYFTSLARQKSDWLGKNVAGGTSPFSLKSGLLGRMSRWRVERAKKVLDSLEEIR
jgi:hypothetical protein